jgi:hypothetical protein
VKTKKLKEKTLLEARVLLETEEAQEDKQVQYNLVQHLKSVQPQRK